MDQITRNDLLLFLLFGLFLLREPQLASPYSMAGPHTAVTERPTTPFGVAYDGATPPLLRHAPSSRPTWPISSAAWAY